MLNKDLTANMPYRSPRAMKRLLAESNWDDLTKCRQGLSREYGDEVDILNEPATPERIACRPTASSVSQFRV